MLANLTNNNLDITELFDYSSPQQLLTALQLLPEIKALYEGGNLSAGVLYLDLTHLMADQLTQELTTGVYTGDEDRLLEIAIELSGLLT